MSADEGSVTSPNPVCQPAPATGPHGEASALLTPEQLKRWAALVAGGKSRLPEGLQAAQEDQLRQEVKRLRRVRLIQFLARQVALALARDRGPREEK